VGLIFEPTDVLFTTADRDNNAAGDDGRPADEVARIEHDPKLLLAFIIVEVEGLVEVLLVLLLDRESA